MSIKSFTNRRRQKLPYQVIAPPSPQAVVVFHHGFAEYCWRYKYLLERFSNLGIAAYSYDCLGHGKADGDGGRMYYIQNHVYLVDDMEDFILQVAMIEQPGVPVLVAGHSMGGFVAALTAIRLQPKVTALLLFSPMIDVKRNLIMKAQEAVGGILNRLVPAQPLVPAVRLPELSPDADLVKSFQDDPMYYKGNVPLRTAWSFKHGMEELATKYEQLQVPILAFHGLEDKVTYIQGTRNLVERCSTTDKELYEFEKGYHVLLEGPEKEELFSKLAAWLAAHLPIKANM